MPQESFERGGRTSLLRLWRPQSLVTFRAVIGAAQLVGGLTAAALALDAGRYRGVPLSTIVVNSGFVAFGLVQVIAGICLARGLRWGPGLTLGVQLVQLPVIAVNGLQYYVASLCGVVASLRTGALIDFQFHLSSQMVLQWNPAPGWFLGINLVPTVILLGMHRALRAPAPAHTAP